jgi:hypothetical protein
MASESELDQLLNNIDSLANCVIYCCYKNNNGKQFRIVFRDNHSYKDTIETIYYRDYIKDTNSYLDISLFGNKLSIIKTLLFNVIDSIVNDGTSVDFLINVGEIDVIPDFDSSVEITYTKEDVTYGDDVCPICRSDWNELVPYKLYCNHMVCRDCMFELFKNKTVFRCPVCRQKNPE